MSVNGHLLYESLNTWALTNIKQLHCVIGCQKYMQKFSSGKIEMLFNINYRFTICDG